MNALMENMRMDAAIVANTTSSAIYSPSYSMAGCHRAAAVIQAGIVAGSTADPCSTGFLLTMQIMGGDSTTVPTSMSSITDAVVAIGTSSTSGLIKGAHAVDIRVASSAAATLASAVSLTIDDTTFTSNSSASAATAHHFLTGLASVVVKSMTTVFKVAFPNMNVTYSGTGGDTCVCSMERVNITPDTSGIYVKATAQTTITGISVRPTKTLAAISLTPGKLCSTASSFTNFAVRVHSTESSVIPLSVMVFRDPVNAPSNLSTLHVKV
jgi:hypothetical protein